MTEVEPKIDPYTRRFGAVALLDALGVATMTIEECSGFLRARDQAIEDAFRWIERVDTFGREIRESLAKMETATFGDSLLITWDLPEGVDSNSGLGPEAWCTAFGFVLSSIVSYSLALPIGWRGAVSLGEFIKDGSTIIGPAVVEAARLYEKADWIGIVASPTLEVGLNRFYEALWRHGKAPTMDQWFVRYPAPLKSGPTEMWCVAWPAHLGRLVAAGKKSDQAEGDHFFYFRRWLSKFPKPPGTELKYTNTELFYDWYWANTRNWGDVYGGRYSAD